MMASLFAAQSTDEPQQHHQDIPQDDGASASSTAVSSSQASPTLHSVEVDARAMQRKLNDLGEATQTAMVPQSILQQVLDLQKQLEAAKEHSRLYEETCKRLEGEVNNISFFFDMILTTWQQKE